MLLNTHSIARLCSPHVGSYPILHPHTRISALEGQWWWWRWLMQLKLSFGSFLGLILNIGRYVTRLPWQISPTDRGRLFDLSIAMMVMELLVMLPCRSYTQGRCCCSCCYRCKCLHAGPCRVHIIRYGSRTSTNVNIRGEITDPSKTM